MMSLKLHIARFLYWLKRRQEDPVELFKEVGIKSDDVILEIGCATGFYTEALSEIVKDGKVYAVDISEEFISYLKKKDRKNDNVTPICESADSVELKENSLDKIICFNTLHEIPDMQRGFDMWLSALKKDGEFIYRDPEIDSDKIPELSKGRLTKVREEGDITIFLLQ